MKKREPEKVTIRHNVTVRNINANLFYEGLGRRIWDLRKERGLTQGDLAEYVGVDRTNVAHIESGRQGVTILTLLLIAEGLKVSLRDLLPEFDGLVCGNAPLSPEKTKPPVMKALAQKPPLRKVTKKAAV